MSKRLRAPRPGHDSVDPWDPSTSPAAAPPRGAGCFRSAAAWSAVAIAAALWLRWPEAAPLEAIAGLALLVPAVLLPVHVLGRQRRRMRNTLRRFSDELDPERWRDAVRQLREDRLGAPSAFDALASGVETVLGEAERRWQALAELSADWFWETDRQHRLSWLSSARAAGAGAGAGRQAALLGRRYDQIGLFRAPEQGWATLHERMTRLEAFRDVEFQVGAPGRPLRWISISGRPRHNAQGTVIGYEGVGRDVTERRQAHEQLRASEQRWSTMARLAADWYWQTDAEHRLLPLDAEQQQRIGAEMNERVEGRTRWDAHRDSLTPSNGPSTAPTWTRAGRSARCSSRSTAATGAGCGSRSAACRASTPAAASSATTAWAATSPRASRRRRCCCATTRRCSARWTNARATCSR